jgi:hypothetical protein
MSRYTYWRIVLDEACKGEEDYGKAAAKAEAFMVLFTIRSIRSFVIRHIAGIAISFPLFFPLVGV